jgi:hypothetical protein
MNEELNQSYKEIPLSPTVSPHFLLNVTLSRKSEDLGETEKIPPPTFSPSFLLNVTLPNKEEILVETETKSNQALILPPLLLSSASVPHIPTNSSLNYTHECQVTEDIHNCFLNQMRITMNHFCKVWL